jgi:hypothetical protein
LKSGRYRVEVERIWCFWQLQLPRRFKKQDNQLRWSPPEREIFQKLPCRFSGNQNGNIYPSRLAIAILDCHIGLPRGQPHFFSWLNHRDVGGEKKHFDHFWSSTNMYIPRIKRFFHQQQDLLLAEISFGAPPSPQLLARCPWLWQIANWDMAPTTSWSPTSRMGCGWEESLPWLFIWYPWVIKHGSMEHLYTVRWCSHWHLHFGNFPAMFGDTGGYLNLPMQNHFFWTICAFRNPLPWVS